MDGVDGASPGHLLASDAPSSPEPGIAQPGLTGAGAALIGAAIAAIGTEVAALDSAAILMGLGCWMMRAGRPRGLALWVALGILGFTCWHGASLHAGRGASVLSGRISHSSRQTSRSPDLAAYQLLTDAGPARLDLPKGSVRDAEFVWVAPDLEGRKWAQSTVAAAPARPLPQRPSADEWARLASPDSARAGLLGWRPLGWVRDRFAAMRRAGVRAMSRHSDPQTGGLLCALLFGETGHLPPGQADLFTRTGTRHLLALSGLHVGLIACLLGWPLAVMIASLAGILASALGFRWRPGPAVPLALLAAAFVPIAGFGAPATRAALGLSVAALSSLARPGSGGRRPTGLNILALALMLEILMEPLAPFATGVQLSYGATAALILVAPRGARRLVLLLPSQENVQPVDKSGRRRPPSARAMWLRATSACSMGIAASIIASLATLPIVWTRFGEWSPSGIIATPLALPMVFILVACGWLSMLVPPWITDAPLQWTTSALLAILSAADHAPWSPIPLPGRPLLLVAAASIAGLMALVAPARGAPESTDQKSALGLWNSNSRSPCFSLPSLGWARLSAAAFAAALIPWATGRTDTIHPGQTIGPIPSGFEVHVLDVGDGNAIVARAPGSRVVLFDAGSRDRIGVASRGVAPLLLAIEAGAIDIVLSHNHTDHYRALPWLARRWSPRHWLGEVPDSREHPSFHVPFASSAVLLAFHPGARAVDFGGGLHGYLVRGGRFEGNEGSSVLDLRWAPRRPCGPEFRVILSGDAEGHGLAAMLRGRGSEPWLEPGPIDALLLPHHGSSSRHLGWLLDHLQPREVWVSSSSTPKGGALEECARRGLPIRVTATDGPILWRSPGP